MRPNMLSHQLHFLRLILPLFFHAVVNTIKNNQFTLHLDSSDISGTQNMFNGLMADSTSCNAANGAGPGCGIKDEDGTGGAPLNEGQGGVWASYWSDEGWSMFCSA